MHISVVLVKLQELAVIQLLAYAALLLIKCCCVEGACCRHNNQSVRLSSKSHDAANILRQPILGKGAF